MAVGGSATVDGGRGALDAIAARGGLAGARLVVLSDVETPWERSAEIYGPQKGADPTAVRRLAARLDAMAAELPRDPRGVPMTGAAGGLSGGLWAAHDASLEPGSTTINTYVIRCPSMSTASPLGTTRYRSGPGHIARVGYSASFPHSKGADASDR